MAQARMQTQQNVNKMVQANLRLVIPIAKEYDRYASIDLLDLIQAGNEGLFTAVDKFNPELGYKFSTHAFNWIRQKIQLLVADMSSNWRTPFSVYIQVRQLYAIQMRLVLEGVHAPKMENIAEELNLSLEETKKIFLMDMPVKYCGISSFGSVNSDYPGEIIVDQAERPEAYILDKVRIQDIDDVLDCLDDERKKKILKLRFGLEDGNVYTLKAVGALFEISYERVRQLEKTALAELREYYSERLHAYL